MSRPHTWTRLIWPTGNNAFAYAERKLVDPEPQLRLPSLKTITTIADVKLGTEPTFAELDDEEKVIMYTGLQHIYHFEQFAFPGLLWWPCYLFDNHNYALYFWATHPWLKCIHIDQHSDLGIPHEPLIYNGESYPQKNGESYSPLQYMDIAHYTTHVCNVGNFIRPAIDVGIITECIRIKNEYDLNKNSGSHPPLQKTKKSLSPSKGGTEGSYILDIDLDFRAPEMGTNLTKSIPLVQSLMRNASLITIATSPYFLEQQYALELLSKLFWK